MNSIYKHIPFALLLLIFFVPSGKSNAQSRLEAKEMLSNARKELYALPQQAIDIGKGISASSSNIDLRIEAHLLISGGYFVKRDFNKALEFAYKAESNLNMSDDKLLKISVLNKLMILYYQLKIYGKAIWYADEIDRLIAKTPNKNSLRTFIGDNYLIQGLIYSQQLNCDIANSFLDKAISEYKKDNENPTIEVNYAAALSGKGNCFLSSGNLDSAVYNFNQAYKYADSSKAEIIKISSEIGLAKVLVLQKNYSEAINLFQKNLNEDLNDLYLQKEIYGGLSKCYLALNDFDNYKRHRNEYLKVSQKTLINENSGINYSIKNSQNYFLNTSKEIKHKFLLIIGALFLLNFVILAFIFKNVSQTKREVNRLKMNE